MKRLISIAITALIFVGCQEQNTNEKKEYVQNENYDWRGKTYQMKGADYYPDGSDEFLALEFDSLGKKYERHLTFYESGKIKRIKLINPQIDTLKYPKKYNDEKRLVYDIFIGYVLKEETFYEDGKYRSITIRNNNILDSTINHIAYKEDGKIKRTTKDRKVNDMWISEGEKDGKKRIDTFYFWK